MPRYGLRIYEDCLSWLPSLSLPPPCSIHSLQIKLFNQSLGFKVFLLSTRAGSVGINLTSARRLVVFDTPWNPVHNAQVGGRERDGGDGGIRASSWEGEGWGR